MVNWHHQVGWHLAYTILLTNNSHDISKVSFLTLEIVMKQKSNLRTEDQAYFLSHCSVFNYVTISKVQLN